jgi:glutamate racemase
VISTDFTAKNHTFKNEILSIDKTATVTEYGEQMLVELVELGATDSAILPREAEYLDRLCAKITLSGASALILGCTHFSHLAEELKRRLNGISVIDTAALGADTLYKSLSSRK